MFEFDSVSVSSFEAASLSAVLTEKSTEGWKVIAIVPAAADIVAYLQRGTGPADAEVVDEVETVTETAAVAIEPAAASLSAIDTTEAGKATVIAGTSPERRDEGSNGWAATSTAAPAATTSSWGGSAQQAAATQPAATSQVPAGWYADPSRRYELRYWDGGNWTEHVSRSGQQYTDPPVA